jgi:ankyrin repeat protein
VAEKLVQVPWFDVNLTDNKGMTALHWAVENGHTSVAKKILEASGVDVNQPPIAAS